MGTEEDFSILFPDLHVIYSTWKDSRKKAQEADDVVEKENEKPTEEEEEEEENLAAEEDEEEENPQSESENEASLLLCHINHQISIFLNNSHIGDIGWSKRIIDCELWTEDDKMDAHMYTRFTRCRRAMFSKNRKKISQYLGLDLIKNKKALPPRCFEFLRFVMYDRIGCLVQICRLLRQQQSLSLIQSSVLEKYITYQEIGEASELLDTHLPIFANVEKEIAKRIQEKEEIASSEFEKSKLVFDSSLSIKLLPVVAHEFEENSPLPELPPPDRSKPVEPKIDESLSTPKLLPSGEVIFPSKNRFHQEINNDSDKEKENRKWAAKESGENDEYEEEEEEDGIKGLLDALIRKSHHAYLGRFSEESEENNDLFYDALTGTKSSNKWRKVPRKSKRRKMKTICVDPVDLIFDDPSDSSSESESLEDEKNLKKRKNKKLVTTRKRKRFSNSPLNSSRRRQKNKTSAKQLNLISTTDSRNKKRNRKRKISQKQTSRKRRKLKTKSTKSKAIRTKKQRSVKKKEATKRKPIRNKASNKQKNNAKKSKIKQKKNSKKAKKATTKQKKNSKKAKKATTKQKKNSKKAKKATTKRKVGN